MDSWSNVWVIGIIVVVCAVAAWASYKILKEEEKKQNKYKNSDTVAEDELARSLDYEKTSLKSNVPILTWIYVISIVASLIAFAFYLI